MMCAQLIVIRRILLLIIIHKHKKNDYGFIPDVSLFIIVGIRIPIANRTPATQAPISAIAIKRLLLVQNLSYSSSIESSTIRNTYVDLVRFDSITRSSLISIRTCFAAARDPYHI